MERLLCVYCSSSDAVDPSFVESARTMGAEMARRGYGLVYGGTTVGLMGALARSVHSHGGRVVGIIPEAIHAMGIGNDLADELIVTPGMRERKAAMEARADGFIALPGGFGTLEELFEVTTLKQLKYHTKPIVILNAGGFYDPLVSLFEHIYQQRFAKPVYRQLYHVAATPAEAMEYLSSYTPPELGTKWL